jgi:hypothetical protein
MDMSQEPRAMASSSSITRIAARVWQESGEKVAWGVEIMANVVKGVVVVGADASSVRLYMHAATDAH